MNKKTITYLLLAVVLGIWGVIGTKLVSGVKAPPVRENGAVRTKAKQPAAVYPLKLNYRNPFFAPVPVKDTVASVARISRPRPAEVKEPVDIQYRGRVTADGEVYYVIELVSGYYSFKPGDTVQGLLLKTEGADSLYFSKGKWVYAVEITNNE